MVIKVYYAEISAQKEVKKHQQRVMMILDSKQIPYDTVDITDPGKEAEKGFMMKNAKPHGDSKTILSPQVFNDDVYCGDYDDFDLANENDALEEFLHTEKVDTLNVSARGSIGSGDKNPSDENSMPSTPQIESVLNHEEKNDTTTSVPPELNTDAHTGNENFEDSSPAPEETSAPNVPENNEERK